MSTITQDLQSIKTVEDTLTSNKVARFAYTQQAYTDNDANGVTEYNPNQEQNIPVADASVMKVNSSILNLGWRTQASALTRMLMNHFLGRISYNLNKVNDNVSAILSALIAKIGQAEGIATLDANGLIPYSQLPEDFLELKGYWNASTNTPALADGTGTIGDFYFVEVAGTQDLGSGEQYFAVGDRVLYDGSVWKNVSSGFIRKINNQVPDIQGNKTLTVGNNSLNITKGFLGAVFGRLLGRVWHQGTGVSTFYTMQYLVYANGLWVCGSANSGMWWSEDGKAWTKGTGKNTNRWMQYLVYVNGLWVCGSANAGMWWSEDGKAWTQGKGANTACAMQYLVYANGLWVCGSYGNGMWWSEDGKAWTKGTGKNTNRYMQYLVYANGLWVCGSTNAGMWWSEDGKAWTQGTGANTPYAMQYPVYANGLWVCGSTSHGNWWSEDGKAWTQGTGANTSYAMQYLVYANGLWVCGSKSNGIWWSEDGKAWTQGTGMNTSYTMQYPVYANGLWVCGSESNGIWWSEDGKAWTQGTGKNANSWMQDLVYANGLWVCGSKSNGMWYADSVEDLIANGTIDFGQAVPIVDA